MGEPEGKKHLARPRRRWEDNILIGWGGTDWINMFQGRNQWRALANTVINLRVRKILGNF
jgi:hypothetical protein